MIHGQQISTINAEQRIAEPAFFVFISVSDFSPKTEDKNSSNSNEPIKNKKSEIEIDNFSSEKQKITLSDKGINTNLFNISSYNTNESSIQNIQQEDSEIKKNNIKLSNKSRFSFVNNCNENIDKKNIFLVPDFVEEILNKKFSLLSFSNLIRRNKNENINKYYSEEVFLADEIQIIKNWAFEK